MAEFESVGEILQRALPDIVPGAEIRDGRMQRVRLTERGRKACRRGSAREAGILDVPTLEVVQVNGDGTLFVRMPKRGGGVAKLEEGEFEPAQPPLAQPSAPRSGETGAGTGGDSSNRDSSEL